jgi:hypothetical protein
MSSNVFVTNDRKQENQSFFDTETKKTTSSQLLSVNQTNNIDYMYGLPNFDSCPHSLSIFQIDIKLIK